MILFLSHGTPQGHTRLRTLIVEDDPTSRDALMRILKMLGFETEAVPTVAAGMEALANKPAALILDLMLPDGNGMQILRRIRDQKLPIRVAVLTGADRPMIDQASALRPDAMFTKPVDLSKLLTWLRAA